MAVPRTAFVTPLSRTPTPRLTTDVSAGWGVLGIVGCAFLAVGLLDLVLAWFPLAFASAEWEFGTITGTLNGMPVIAMGLGLAMAGALGLRGTRRARLLCSFAALLTLFLLACAFLYLTVLPTALAGTRDAVVAASLRKAGLKAGVLLVVYPLLFVLVAVLGWRRSSKT